MPMTNTAKKTSHSQGTYPTKEHAQSSTATSSQSKESYNSHSARAGNMVHTDNSVTIDVKKGDVIQSVSNSNIDVSVLTEQFTKTVTIAVMTNLQAAGFLGMSILRFLVSQINCQMNVRFLLW